MCPGIYATLQRTSGSISKANHADGPAGHCIAIAKPATPANSSACADATSSSSRVRT